MTAREVAQTMAVVRAAWPHSNIDRDDPESALKVWHSVLRAAEFAEAQAAIDELLAAGREHAPPVSVIVSTIARRRDDAPDFDQAWPEVQRLIRRRGLNQRPLPEDFSHPVVAVFAIHAWPELCMGPAEGTSGYGTHYAQQREAFKALAGRARRDTSLGLVGAPRTRGNLRRFDAAALLPEGSPDAAA